MLNGRSLETETSPETARAPIRRGDLVDNKRGITRPTVNVGNRVIGGMVIAGLDKGQLADIFPEVEPELMADADDQPDVSS